MNTTWLKNIWYWKLAVIRCCIYGLGVAWGVWKAGTNGFDALSDMTSMQRTDLFGDMAMAFGGVLLAFLDSTIQILKGNGNGNGNGTNQPAGPPPVQTTKQ